MHNERCYETFNTSTTKFIKWKILTSKYVFHRGSFESVQVDDLPGRSPQQGRQSAAHAMQQWCVQFHVDRQKSHQTGHCLNSCWSRLLFKTLCKVVNYKTKYKFKYCWILFKVLLLLLTPNKYNFFVGCWFKVKVFWNKSCVFISCYANRWYSSAKHAGWRKRCVAAVNAWESATRDTL